MAIPLLGRLSVAEYCILSVSFTLAWLEYIISYITHILPSPVINGFTFTVKKIYNMLNLTISYNSDKRYQYLYEQEQNEIDKATYLRMTRLIECKDISELAAVFGYDIQSHVVRTADDYLLTIHRVMKSPDESPPRNGKVVYLHHGLLMSSEIWLTMLQKHENLPFLLYDLGYDVWLGNNRGNKYCQKHTFLRKPEDFWDFSIDEFAMFDIPNIIEYILDYTLEPSLTYIGFSQGTAQAFASVSINNELNSKIDKIIAISPATTPHGLYSKFLDIVIKASPDIIYLLFSRKILMPSIQFWQKIMYPPLFNTSIDISNYMLFNWKAKNITRIQKLCSYSHLYSTTSVKTVVHWFQIMKNKNFQMYIDNNYYPTTYPLKNITIPIYLIYGDSDSLVDISVMKRQLPSELGASVAVQGHEHLDNLWGVDVNPNVFSHVLRFMDSNIHQNGSVHKE
ncbi:cholesterol esterase [Yamadazyma tenuis]|uniref:Alpha/beta-hydrolase n=1 Tax=Candida tenuis (strain ATCC 10573 / BCRC 21748 / CBS 615 / JCM 9827 / NBRC 10315 / NRRL Y-1498 / VKM Y-70) TaxID=590646 RepID=G3B5E4_CANTC|nr:alpha/beta-hydrolase [Yamadazyma tenuis ATCC 10573]EGV63199.1 alpha/beta-hydrolase [Yamadazyma tenuis ATCC 10573]WEJ96976.1 cholesterol esterase [Yamadazyma tenuis]